MAISWSSKGPGETDTRRHDFSAMLDDGETVTAYTATRRLGTVTINSPTFPTAPEAGAVDYVLSGGADGETAIWDVVLTTSAGRTLNEEITMPVVVITADAVRKFQARFPGRFDAVPDIIIDRALSRAGRMVDESWAADDIDEAQQLYAASWLLSEGFGIAPAGVAEGLAGIKSVRSGALSMEFAGASAAAPTDPALNTPYGQKFLALLRKNRGGPRITGAGHFAPSCGYYRGW